MTPWERWAWRGLFVFALALRVPGLDLSASTPWGRPDEETFVMRGLHLFEGGNDPGVAHSGWPDAWFWFHHWVQRLLLAFWQWRYEDTPNLGCLFVLSPNTLIFPVRLVCALMGAATAVILGRAAMEMAPLGTASDTRRAIGLSGAFFYAVNVLAVRDAHYAVSDTPTVLCLALLLLWGARAANGGPVRHYALAGLALGLAISIKWAALPFGIIPVLGIGLRLFARHGKWLTLKGTLAGTFTTALGFVAGTPHFLDDPQSYYDGLVGHAMRYDPESARSFIYDATVEPTLGAETHLVLSLPFGFGWPLLALAIALTLYAIVRRRELRSPMLFATAVYALFFYGAVVGRTTLNFARYSLPIHPALAVVAAALLPTLLRGLAPALVRKRPLATILGASFVLALSPLVRSIDVNRLLVAPETRELASRWLREHAGDEPVAIQQGYHGLYAVDAQLASACEAQLPAPLVGWIPRKDAGGGLAPLASVGESDWDTIAERSTHGQIWGPDSPLRGVPYAVTAQPFVPCGRGVPPLFAARRLPSCFHEVARFDQGDVACDTAYDVMDHYYIAMSLDPGAVRPGPEIVIYQNDCEP